MTDQPEEEHGKGKMICPGCAQWISVPIPFGPRKIIKVTCMWCSTEFYYLHPTGRSASGAEDV